jgi:hypothetical protein
MNHGEPFPGPGGYGQDILNAQAETTMALACTLRNWVWSRASESHVFHVENINLAKVMFLLSFLVV